MDNEFTNYLKQSTTQFNNWERNVIIQMDEIHVKSTFTYKGGKIIGSLLNPTDPAKTVFAFMVSSLSKNGLLLFVCFLVQPLQQSRYSLSLNLSFEM